MSIHEPHTAEQTILDAVTQRGIAEPFVLCEDPPDYEKSLESKPHPVRQDHVLAAHFTRKNSEMMVKSWIRAEVHSRSAQSQNRRSALSHRRGY